MQRTIIFLSAVALTTMTFSIADAAMAQPAERPDREPMTREAVEARSNEAFAKLDVNRDGLLSKADREAKARERFEAADTDGNGQLSFEEATAAREGGRDALREHLGETRRGSRMGEGPMMGGRDGRGLHSLAGIVRHADGNGDEQISRSEFTAAALARFDQADADGDGTISREERRAARGKMRQGRGRFGA
ncbi:MAG TPA: EF-hand domain-containing protein [Sphingomonadaceae bacterium]|nr:EF-hand domain-containing protein [Sphingomonadaceae bacterium]